MTKRLRSLREYVAALDEIGDLREVTEEFDPHLEVGALIRHAAETEGPAPLFTRLRGCRPGFRILGSPGALSSRPGSRFARAALSLGFDPDTPPARLVEAIADARGRDPVPPVRVSSGPCQENVLLGEDASLDRFPVPYLHEGDGGRYVNTWGTIVVRTPDGTWTNWSIARVMQVDAGTMSGLIMPPQDIGKIYRLWQDQGEPMPFAIAQGGEPAIPWISGMGLPPFTDESGMVGAHFGEPVELVRCVSVDLEVPATSEIVIEGHVPVAETAAEGPMGEFLGYISGTPQQRPVYRISAITHRDDPILPVVSAGKPVEEDHTVVGLTYSGDALHTLRRAGLPVSGAWLVPESAVNLLVVTVPRDWRSRCLYTSTRLLTRALAQAVMRPKVSYWTTRLMVVDDDIDPTDLRDLMWAFATRSHPSKGLVALEDERVTVLHLFYSDEERRQGGTKMAYDCLLDPDPARRPRSTAFADNFPADVRGKVLSAWG